MAPLSHEALGIVHDVRGRRPRRPRLRDSRVGARRRAVPTARRGARRRRGRRRVRAPDHRYRRPPLRGAPAAPGRCVHDDGGPWGDGLSGGHVQRGLGHVRRVVLRGFLRRLFKQLQLRMRRVQRMRVMFGARGHRVRHQQKCPSRLRRLFGGHVRPGADACTECVGGADARTKSLADAGSDSCSDAGSDASASA